MSDDTPRLGSFTAYLESTQGAKSETAEAGDIDEYGRGSRYSRATGVTSGWVDRIPGI